ncbi:MAG: sugar-binding protein [Melioribacteraceae bacterium]
MKKIFFFLILFLSISLNAQWVFQNCDNSVANNFWDLSQFWSNGIGAYLNITDNTDAFEANGSVKIEYNVVAGDDWGGFVSRLTNQISGYYDFSSAQYISFWIKNINPLAKSQNGEFHLEFKLIDYDDNMNRDVWMQNIPLDLTDAPSNWINIMIPLVNTDNPNTGFKNQYAFNNGVMELDKIKNFEIALSYNTVGGGTPNPTATGSFLLDKFEIVGSKYPPLTTFDNTAVNFFNMDDMGWAGESDKGSIQLTDETFDKIEGNASLKLDYTVNASQSWGGYIRVYKDIIKPNDFENRTNLVIYVKNEIPSVSPNTNRLNLNFYIVEDNTGVDEMWRIRLPINLLQGTGWTRYVLPLRQSLTSAENVLPTDGFAKYIVDSSGDDIFNPDYIKSYGIDIAAYGTEAGPLGEQFTGTILFDLLQQGGETFDLEAPEAPGNFTVTPGTYNNTFTWTDVTNEGAGEKYLIYGSQNAFTDITEPGVELIGFYYENVGNGIHYLRSPKVDANVTNYYGIRSVDLANNIGPFAFASPVTNMAKGIGVISLNPPVNFNADGDLSEWNTYQPIEIKLSNQTGFIGPNFQVTDDNDLSAVARIAIDSKYLYVAFDVEDNVVLPNEPVPSYLNDSAELLIGLYDLIGLQHDSYQRGDFPDYHLRFNKFALSSGNVTMFVNQLLFPGPDYGWFEKFPTGYVVEAKIPLADLAQMRDNYGEPIDRTFVPMPGMKIPLDINLNDQDVSGNREGLLYFSHFNEDQSWNNPQRWGNTWTDTKYLMLVAPRDISVFNPTEVIPLQWNYAGVTNIKIEFSTNGNNYSLVEASVPANQTYYWTVPNVESDICYIRITDVDNTFYTSKNPDPFTITIANYTLEQEDNNGFSRANQTQLGNIISGELINGDDTDFFKFFGNAGDQIDIEGHANNSTLNGMIFLFDANKNQIASSANYMDDHLRQRIVFSLPETGEYYIRYSTVWNYYIDFNSSIKEKIEPTVTEALFRGAYKISLKLWQVSEPQLSWSVRNSDLFSNDGRIEIEAASNGNPITLKYAYSTDYSYSNTVPDQSFPAATWNYWATSDKISGLTPNTQYNVRVTLESTYGTVESFGRFTTPPASQTFVKKANLGGFFNDIEFSDGSAIYVVGSGIFRSTNIGGNWEDVNAIPFFREIYSAEVVGTSEVVTLGDHIIVKSMDGGVSWGYEDFPHNNWRDVDFIDFNNGFFCGDGEIIRTNDNGANGTNVYTGERNFNRIIMHDINTVYAVGDRGAIFKTTDAGNNYSITFHNYKGWQLYGIDFFDYNNGVAVGENGNLLTTTDGGETWKQHYEFNETLYDVKMVSATEFYIVGNYGLIIHSTDGGNNFDIIESGTRNRLKRIAINNGKMWICGDWGTVLGPTGVPLNVTFNVDMKIQHLEGKFNPITDQVSVRGAFNGWAEEIMTDSDGDGVYSITKSLFSNSNFEYKFYSNSQTMPNWGWETNVGPGGPDGNRVLTLEEVDLDLATVKFDNKNNEMSWYSYIRLEDGADVFTGFFGTHANATDGIDQTVYERALPSDPQEGMIDLRFAIPGGVDKSVRDFRNNTFDKIEWIIEYQRGSSNDPFKFRWNPNLFPNDIKIIISDISSKVFSIDMMSTDFVEISDFEISSVKITCYKVQSKRYELSGGWNMVSVPVIADNMSPAAIFPHNVSSTWGFNETGYYTANPLELAKGYWIKNQVTESYNLLGIRSDDFIIDLKAGWNMIGVYDRDVIITQITTDPVNIISSSFFEYNNGYNVPFLLKYGKGYWVKATADGTIDLAPFKSPSIKKERYLASQYATAPELNSSWGKIIITDAAGRQGVVYDSGKDNINLSQYELPPIPPSGIFDIRFSSNRYVENLNSENLSIKINSDQYPIKIKVEGIDILIDGKALKNGSEITIAKEMPSSVAVSKLEIPVQYTLMQNYPNPFNPSTIIRFGLPEQTNVHLEIFNVLGERVDELINKEMEPGFHEVTWNAKSLPSGIYIYSIRTSQFNDVKKMMFIK